MEVKIEITCPCGNKSWVQLLAGQKEYTCDACGSELFKAHITNGYVYILSNPSMPNLLKIGYTERNVGERVDELNSTGVPVPFEIEAIFGSPDAYGDEQAIHNLLAHHRLASNREFFSIELKQAIQCVAEYLKTEPCFIKCPELLMNEGEKEIYRVSVEISELENLRNDYINLVPKIKWAEWTDFIKSKTEKRRFETNDLKEKYERSLVNTLLIDHFSSSPDERDSMRCCFDRLDSLLIQIQ
jgi:hypothetical protein